MTTDNTILFDKIVFGPLKSRRLGLSLGINLLPTESKFCNFNCIYCECGWTPQHAKVKFNPAKEIHRELEAAMLRLKKEGITPDTITFAGNGEPTLHPEFDKIMDETIVLRNVHFPNAKIAVLTNATMLNIKKVVEALKLADLRILKLDAGTDELFYKIDQPVTKRSLRWIVDHLHCFKGDLIVQTMFLKGEVNGVYLDNTSEEELKEWLKLIGEIHPETVMLYSLDRASPATHLEKIPFEKLKEIALRVEKLGIKTIVT